MSPTQKQSIYDPGRHPVFADTNVYSLRYLNIEETARQLQVAIDDVQQSVNNGKIPYIRVNGETFIAETWVHMELMADEEITCYRMVKSRERDVVDVVYDIYSLIQLLKRLEYGEEAQIEKVKIPRIEIKTSSPEKEFIDCPHHLCVVYSKMDGKKVFFYTHKPPKKSSLTLQTAYTMIKCTNEEYQKLKLRVLQQKNASQILAKENHVFTFIYDIVL